MTADRRGWGVVCVFTWRYTVAGGTEAAGVMEEGGLYGGPGWPQQVSFSIWPAVTWARQPKEGERYPTKNLEPVNTEPTSSGLTVTTNPTSWTHAR